MARGRAPGYDAQRETILSQAAELFARQGFVGTSMNEVAAGFVLTCQAHPLTARVVISFDER